MNNTINSAVGAQVEVFLKPGQWFFGGPKARVRTTLGSCVAFTFWHSKFHLGGTCHYMLPQCASAKNAVERDARYADEALALLSDAAGVHGTRLRDYQVKIFGGAEMFDLPTPAFPSVARCNIAKAQELVRSYGLVVSGQCLGGSRYREVIFSIDTGDAWVRSGPISPRPMPKSLLAGGGL